MLKSGQNFDEGSNIRKLVIKSNNRSDKLVFYDEKVILQGRRTSNVGGPNQRAETPAISLFQDELESEDYIFRTNIDEMES